MFDWIRDDKNYFLLVQTSVQESDRHLILFYLFQNQFGWESRESL